MTARFVVVRPHRGPADPGPLAGYVDWRPEAARPWWATDASGRVLAMCATHEQAQRALNGQPKQAIGG